jgi:hypothetical protein
MTTHSRLTGRRDAPHAAALGVIAPAPDWFPDGREALTGKAWALTLHQDSRRALAKIARLN